MATQIWVNISSGNGLLPDGNKPIPEPKFINHQQGPVASTRGNFIENAHDTYIYLCYEFEND